MTSGTFNKAALAAILTLSATGAMAQTLPTPSTVGPYAGSSRVEVREVIPQERPLTVMGMTGGIKPKDPEYTGSIAPQPDRPQWLRLR